MKRSTLIGAILSFALFPLLAFALDLPPLANFESNKVLKAADLKALLQNVIDLNAWRAASASIPLLNRLEVNGSIVAGPGSIGGPAYMFSPAATYGATGLYAPGPNILGFVTSGAERMRLTAAGDLGIGTRESGNPAIQYPGNVLEVQRNQNGATAIIIRNTPVPAGTTPNGSSNLAFANDVDDQDGFLQINSSTNQSYAGPRSFNFISNVAGFAFFNRYVNPAVALRIAPNGNVGIGTISPNAQLDVDGSVRIGRSGSATGITLYDTANGTPYCVRITNGALAPTSGECSN